MISTVGFLSPLICCANLSLPVVQTLLCRLPDYSACREVWYFSPEKDYMAILLYILHTLYGIVKNFQPFLQNFMNRFTFLPVCPSARRPRSCKPGGGMVEFPAWRAAL
jgi:hypothetical protein